MTWSRLLREHWATVPTAGGERVATARLLELADDELLSMWRRIRDEDAALGQRGWYRLLYREFVAGRRLLDVGCGLALDTLSFAEQGARVVCVDLAESNLRVVEKVAALLGVDDRVDVFQLEQTTDVAALPYEFDAVLAIGSLHHAPETGVGPEARELVEHLSVGGRWLQFAYPRARWEGDGSPAFDRWGEITDGTGTPWAEWYDAAKLLQMLAPHRMEIVFEAEWHSAEFNWIDLVKVV